MVNWVPISNPEKGLNEGGGQNYRVIILILLPKLTAIGRATNH